MPIFIKVLKVPNECQLLVYLYNELLKGFNSKDRINITVGEHNLSYKKVASSIRIDVTKPYETDG